MTQDTELDQKFNKTVDSFMEAAVSKEKELSVPQVSSSFLYTSACYSARYFAIKSEKEKISLEEFVREHVEFFESALRNGIEYYTTDDGDV